MTKFEIAPTETDIGTFTDNDGVEYVAVKLQAPGDQEEVILYYKLPAFVSFADHLTAVADELVKQRS